MARSDTPKNPVEEPPRDPANFIRAFRKRLDLSLHDLADRVGVSHQTIQQWEVRGNIQIRELPKLAAALGCSPADLVPGSALTPEEVELLSLFRSASARERRAALLTLQALTEPDRAQFDHRPPTPKPRRHGR